MRIQISKKVAGKIDAQQNYNQVRKFHPHSVEKAHELMVKCLADSDPNRLAIFLGEAHEDGDDSISFSNERFMLGFVHLDICRKLEFIEKHKEEWDEYMLEWFARRLLKLPFKTINGCKEKSP